MGRDEHRHRKNKTNLPQTPKYEKGYDGVGVDIEMTENPKMQFGVIQHEYEDDHEEDEVK
ncbi:hypothetical protein J2T56_000632 [Natronobacillus azotifigens]|uniref:Uncharacterized protein n=1 Tax=Natronobacillus azotifigens TaxID=472978 RepID=A0A9J6RAI3_9BACI|nr:hypothetical protein [Natronobacillus azotifigens]MCZ0702664.1 hypothetical protein [Natronobacillus azotifigens]